MESKGTEAESIQEKDLDRAKAMITDSQKREYKKFLKEEVELMELQIKYYNYQMTLPGLYQKFMEMQAQNAKMSEETKSKSENKSENSTGIKVDNKE